MSICKHCGAIGGWHESWCCPPLPKPTTRIEYTGNIQVHHPVKEQPATFHTTAKEFAVMSA